MRYDFGSDNTAGMALSAIEGLVRANKGFARAYGGADITARALCAHGGEEGDCVGAGVPIPYRRDGSIVFRLKGPVISAGRV